MVGGLHCFWRSPASSNAAGRSKTRLTISHPPLLSVWRPQLPPKESSPTLPLSSASYPIFLQPAEIWHCHFFP